MMLSPFYRVGFWGFACHPPEPQPCGFQFQVNCFGIYAALYIKLFDESNYTSFNI